MPQELLHVAAVGCSEFSC